ncbi:serine protease [Bdellovibrio bacteriovorus]|uniref:S1 family peptidase n=1 Tax=Bdellovibrio bacteriovorus TaxID=959 RepID=UPI0021D22C24|nr:serine protease [Bdellovibrio bacteriovorus]UXR65301.1 serine protease [Bdellovibrio bacteriovorus]
MSYRSLFFLPILLLTLTSCQPAQRPEAQKAAFANGIIGGSPTVLGEFPFMVNIWFNDPKEDYVSHHCGGSLIASRWVLTAAHCVLEDESETRQRIVAPSKLMLFIGGIEQSGKDGHPLKIRSIQTHPDFAWPKADIALIELSEAVTDIVPLALNDLDLGSSTQKVLVTGWGLTDSEGHKESPWLQKLEAPLLPRALCAQDDFPKKRGYELGPETLCIETYQHLKSSCPGDSGGPVFLQRDNLYVQVGVVSWGSACSGFRAKGSSVGGYAAVSYALPWIKKVLTGSK